jgi:spermidine synthase
MASMRVRTVTVDGQCVTLRERGGEVDVVLGGVVLLSSAALETERSFGALAGSLPGSPARQVLVGGLGFGATVRGVLEACPQVERVVVAERTAAIEHLARTDLAHLTGGVLDDPRVEVIRGDVGALYASLPGLDAILLDVDNGPGWASYRDNARLYAPAGLAAASAALAPGGLFSVWSGYAADAFVGKLRAAGFQPSVVPLHERGVVRARAYVGIKPR